MLEGAAHCYLSCVVGMRQQEQFPVTLLFPCARGCGLSCFSSFVMDDKDGSYEAFTLQRGDDNTTSLHREVSHFT